MSLKKISDHRVQKHRWWLWIPGSVLRTAPE
jgi:hypothetical protein